MALTAEINAKISDIQFRIDEVKKDADGKLDKLRAAIDELRSLKALVTPELENIVKDFRRLQKV